MGWAGTGLDGCRWGMGEKVKLIIYSVIYNNAALRFV
jgi:hypothetical protein